MSSNMKIYFKMFVKKRDVAVDFFGFLTDIKKYNKDENLDLRKVVFWPYSTDFKKDLDY